MKLLYHNKKGISEIVSYVLLIVIAIAVSVVVFVFLKTLVPGNVPECPEGVSIFLRDYTCTISSGQGNLTLELVNNGLFTIDAVYIRAAEEGRTARTRLNPEKQAGDKDFFVNIEPNSQSKRLSLYNSLLSDTSKNYILEIQPALVDKKGVLAACTKSVISHKFKCLNSGSAP